MTGVYVAAGLTAVGTWLGPTATAAVEAGTASAAVGAAANKILAPTSHGVTIPPPPGAAMIDPAGAKANAMIRQRQAAAGGINSTITGAGNTPSAGATGATSGGKSLLGQ